MPMKFQLREHRTNSAYTTMVEFLWDGTTWLIIDSYQELVSPRGNGYTFRNFLRSYLHGKKIRYAWYGSTGAPIATWAYSELLDGHYERASMTDFPDGADRILKGSGILYTFETYTGSFPLHEYTSSVLDLSSGTQDDVCLFFKLRDVRTDRGYFMYLNYIQILDADNNVLMEEHFTSNVTMEVTETMNDYGYISLDIITVDKVSGEYYGLTEQAVHVTVPTEFAPSDLIDRAISYSRKAYMDFKNQNFGIIEPLTPNAIYGTRYLRLREDLNRGAREASHEIPRKELRPVGFSVLMMALYDIFHGRNPTLAKQTYNETLRRYHIIPPFEAFLERYIRITYESLARKPEIEQTQPITAFLPFQTQAKKPDILRSQDLPLIPYQRTAIKPQATKEIQPFITLIKGAWKATLGTAYMKLSGDGIGRIPEAYRTIQNYLSTLVNRCQISVEPYTAPMLNPTILYEANEPEIPVTQPIGLAPYEKLAKTPDITEEPTFPLTSPVTQTIKPQTSSEVPKCGLSACEGSYIIVHGTYIPIADAWVTTETPNTNYGKELFWGIGHYFSYPNHHWYRAWLKFNFGMIPPITSAKLYAYYYSRWGTYTHNIYSVKAPNTWDEYTITWNNQPALGDVVDTILFANDGNYGWRYLGELAPYVNERTAIDGIMTVVLRVLEDPVWWGSVRSEPLFRSREHDLKPYILITY